jgi:hypothetical protein
MFKISLSIVMILAFLFFDWACIIHKVYNEPVTSVTDRDDVVGVTKISGEDLKFYKDNAARVVGNQIVLRNNTIALSDVKDFKQNPKGMVYEITTKDGRSIRDVEGKVLGEKIVLPLLNIPLSEVKSISVRRIQEGKSYLATLGVVIGVLGIIIIDEFSRPYRSGWYNNNR